MSEANSTSVRAGGKTEKPNKPYPELPRFANATNRWTKKIRGKIHYFSPSTDPDGALAKYLAE